MFTLYHYLQMEVVLMATSIFHSIEFLHLVLIA